MKNKGILIFMLINMMELDKNVIKALNSQTRIKILKALLDRQKMPTELSAELKLAGSTVVEHLKILQTSGLVLKKNTGRKWVYYELTSSGKSIIKPKAPVQFFVVLFLGIAIIFSGLIKYVYSPIQNITALDSMEAGAAKAIQTNYIQRTDYLFIILIAVGILLVLLSIWKLRK